MDRSVLLGALFLAANAGAQSWCPPGAVWTHDYVDAFAQGGHGVTRVVYEGDTTVGGHSAQKLRATTVIAPWGSTEYAAQTDPVPLLTRYADGVVYSWSSWQEEFDTLMWFTAVPGQFWSQPEMDDPYNRLTVLDTSTVQVDGMSLRQLILQRGEWDWEPPDTLRERIGFSFNYLAPWTWFVTDQPWTGLRCYRDDQIAYAGPGVTDCGYTLSIADERSSALRPAPNPGNDQLTIPLPAGAHTVQLLDATGRAVLTERVMGPAARLSTAQLPAGPYTVRIAGHAPVRWVKQ